VPKKYKDEFYNLYKRKILNKYNFFTEVSDIIDDKKFKYLICNIDSEIMKCAVNIAKEKSNFTMNQNQAGVLRSEVVKLKKSTQGVLAEMFIHFLLLERYNFNVLRYDLERPTFIYSTEEYDLKIIDDYGFEYEVESRSSNIHHTAIKRFVKEDVIIGPYGNKFKTMDVFADFHFRPVYMPNFEPFKEEFGETIYNSDMFNGKILLVITGVATKEDFMNFSYKVSLGQKGTTYYVVRADVAGDVSTMDKKFSIFKTNN